MSVLDYFSSLFEVKPMTSKRDGNKNEKMDGDVLFHRRSCCEFLICLDQF